MNMKSFFWASAAILLVGYTSQSLASYEVLASEQYREYLKENVPEILKDMDEENAAKLRRQEFKEKGYYNTYSNSAALLIPMKEQKAIKTIDLDEYSDYTRLRENASDIPLSFPYSGIASISAEDSIGYGPAGSEEENGVWTGIGGYFNHVNFGTCRIVIFDLGTNGKSVYDRSNISYEVNSKPTNRYIEGNNDSGFLYTISWTGERYEKILDCANNDPFNSETMAKLTMFAKIIDEDVIDSP